jgi:phosphoglycerate kinase
VTVVRPDGQVRVVMPTDVQPEDKIVDIGPETVAQFAKHLLKAQFILWNGPTGLYEDGFLTYTHQVGELVSRRVEAGAATVIGGGDTIVALQESGSNMEKLGFLSTGGGAMLEFLMHGTLPALAALE